MLKRSLAVLFLYLLLAVVFTYPLILFLSSRTPAGEAWTYDGFSMIWNLWWFRHALLVLNSNPFVTDSLFTPLGTSLYLHSYTLCNALVALPLLAWLTPVTVSNLILIGSLALCGYGMYLLAKCQILNCRLQIERPSKRQSAIQNLQWEGAAFVAGIVFAITTSRFVFLAQGHYNFFTTQWLPFYLLYFLRAMRQPSRHNIGLAGLFLALTLLVELSLGVMLALLTGLYWILDSLVWQSRWRKLSTGAFVVASIFLIASLIDAPYLLPTLRESFDPKYIPQYWGGAPVLSADVVGMFAPSSLHTFLGTHDWPREWLEVLQRKARFVDLNTFVIGFGVLALSLLAAVTQWRRVRVWCGLALVLVVLSWGPILHVNGQSVFDLDGLKVTVGLPYIILHYIPILNGLRAPHRFSVAAMMIFALLVGFAVAWLFARLAQVEWPPRAQIAAQWLMLGVVACVVSFEHLTLPVPLSDATIPSIYDRIAQAPGDFTIMDIPLGWRSGFGPIGTENTQLQYYQVAHGKRLVSGFAARTPSFLFDYFQRQPILNAIAQLESEGRLPQGEAVHDKALAAQLAYFLDLRYILVHPPATAPTPYDTTMRRVHDYIREVFDLDELESRDGITLYRVNQPAAQTRFTLDFGSDASSLNRGEGWERDEEIAGAMANWMVERAARVFVPLRVVSDYRLTVRAVPFVYPDHPVQTLALRVNGNTMTPIRMSDEWNEYVFDLSARDLVSGLNEIIFYASSAAAPARVLPASPDTRPLSVAVDWIRVDIR